MCVCVHVCLSTLPTPSPKFDLILLWEIVIWIFSFIGGIQSLFVPSTGFWTLQNGDFLVTVEDDNNYDNNDDNNKDNNSNDKNTHNND